MLTITVNSFSYLKGSYPLDESGHGGGFVFDCRALPNPGRYDQYKKLSGLDKEVQLFLADKPEVDAFLDAVYALVSQSVEVYQKRGFSNLMVNFGCTGGQHRSVYAAEWLVKRLNSRFDVDVILTHLRKENWG